MSDESLPKAPAEHPNPGLYFKVRRETMWKTQTQSIVLFIILMVLAYFQPEAVEVLTPSIIAIFGLLALPTIGYYSNTAVEEWAKRR